MFAPMGSPQNTHQQRPALPYPTDRPLYQLIPNPYVSTPPHPEFEAERNTPALYEFIGMVAAELVNTIQSTLNNSPARMFFYNRLAENGYQNRYYPYVVTTIVGFALGLAGKNNCAPRDCVPMAVEHMLPMILAQMVETEYPDLRNYLSPEGQQASREYYSQLGAASQLTEYYMKAGLQLLDQTQQQPQYPQQQFPYQQPQQPMQPQYQPPQQQGGWGAPSQHQQFGQQWGNASQPNPNMGGPFGMQNNGGRFPNAPSNHHMAANGQGVGSIFQQPSGGGGPSVGQDPHNARLARKDFTIPNRQGSAPEEPQTPQTPPQTPPPVHSTNRGAPMGQEIYPDDNRSLLSRHYDTPRPQAEYQKPAQGSKPYLARDEAFEDVTPQQQKKNVFAESSNPRPADYWIWNVDGMKIEMVPKHLSPWKHNDLKQPISLAYDPRTQVKFHGRWPDGTVREVVLPMEEGMEYINNEIQLTNRVKGMRAEDRTPVAPEWEAVERIRPFPTEDEDGNIDLTDIKEDKTPFEVPETFYASTLKDAELERDLFFLEHDMDEKVAKSVHEFSFHKTTTFLDLNLNGDPVYNEILPMALTDDPTIDEFHETFAGLRGTLDDRIWHHINDVTTQKVNEILQSSMGHELRSWNIDDFALDWNDLLPALQETYGSDVGLDIFTKFERVARKRVVLGGCKVLVGDALTPYLDTLPERYQTAMTNMKDRVVALSEHCHVTQVGWTLADLPDLFDEDTQAAVLMSKRPVLYKALSSILRRADKKASKNGCSVAHYYLRTPDNTTLEIERGAFNREHFVLRVVNVE